MVGGTKIYRVRRIGKNTTDIATITDDINTEPQLTGELDHNTDIRLLTILHQNICNTPHDNYFVTNDRNANEHHPKIYTHVKHVHSADNAHYFICVISNCVGHGSDRHIKFKYYVYVVDTVNDRNVYDQDIFHNLNAESMLYPGERINEVGNILSHPTRQPIDMNNRYKEVCDNKITKFMHSNLRNMDDVLDVPVKLYPEIVHTNRNIITDQLHQIYGTPSITRQRDAIKYRIGD
jgi:hypothetical protein